MLTPHTISWLNAVWFHLNARLRSLSVYRIFTQNLSMAYYRKTTMCCNTVNIRNQLWRLNLSDREPPLVFSSCRQLLVRDVFFIHGFIGFYNVGCFISYITLSPKCPKCPKCPVYVQTLHENSLVQMMFTLFFLSAKRMWFSESERLDWMNG